MKLTTIMYLHEIVNQKPLRARNSVFWFNFQEFLDCIKYSHIRCTLLYIASLVKFCTNWTDLGEYSMKNHPNRFKMIASLTFEDLKNENQNCCLQETYLGYVTL